MSENELPVKEGFFSKIKRAISVIRGEDPYSKLQEQARELESRKEQLDSREEALNQRAEELIQLKNSLDVKEEALNQREKAINERAKNVRLQEQQITTTKSTLESQQKTASAQVNLYAEQKRISPEIPEIQVHAGKSVSNRFQSLQKSLEELEEKVVQLKGTAGTKEEKEMIENEYAFLKGKLLGEMAVLMETMTPKEISTTIIGDKKATVGMVAEQLPKILGIVESNEQGHKVYPYDKSKSYEQNREIQNSWMKGMMESYSEGLMDLYRIGFLKGDTHDLADFTYNFKADDQDNIAWILNNYFGVDFGPKMKNGIDNRAKWHPLRNFRKPQQMGEMSISNNPVVGEIMEQIGEIEEDFSEVDR